MPDPTPILLSSEEEGICNFYVLLRHIGLLLEKIRREGYEFSVTPPEIVFREDPKTKELLEPVEKITFEIEDRFSALILDKMNQRKATYMSSENKGDKVKMDFICTTRALIGIRT
jgi:GTP-binding protein